MKKKFFTFQCLFVSFFDHSCIYLSTLFMGKIFFFFLVNSFFFLTKRERDTFSNKCTALCDGD